MADVFMRILLSASAGNTMSVIGGVAKALGSGGGLAGVAMTAGLAAGALAIGLGVASVKASADFQTAMLSNVAHAGLARSEFGKVSRAVLQMATDVGRSPTQLAEAMYPILSAFSGITNQSAKSALALDTLKLSFQAVAGTTVNGTDVANAAVGTFNALGLATNNATTNASRMKTLFDQMDLTVQLGNMQWSAYKNVISKLAVSIQGTGISFTEASAALATMTNEGFSAQKAQTYLSNAFVTMAIKTDAMAAHAKKLKISFDENAYSSMNLAGKIHYLNQITDGNKQKILALLGGNATALKTFNALSTGMKSYEGNVKSLSHSQGALKTSFDIASQGFNFQMQRIKASGEVLLITIGNELLPTVTQVAKAVVPVIAGFAKWVASSGGLKNAVTGVVNGIRTMIATGSNLYNFFSKNHTALVLLELGLVALSGAIIGAMVPSMIAGTIALWGMAVAAWAALVPLLPFILIGAAVALAIVGIVLAVQHWGQIAHWLQGVWGSVVAWLKSVWMAFSAWFMGALHAIGAFFTGLWTGSVNATKAGWSWIVNAVKVGAAFMLSAFTSPFRAVAQLFVWLYNHNYYFKALVDKINSIVSAGLAILKNAWSTAVKWVIEQFTILRTGAEIIWSAVTSVIQAKIQQAQSIITSVWSSISSWLQSQWGRLSSFAQSAWSSVVSVFQGVWGRISGALSSLWNNLSSWFSNLAAQALSWGSNIVNSIANGIRNAAGAVGQAAGAVAQTIKDFLGFHSPTKRGAGSTAHLWIPALVKMMSDDLKNGSPKAMQAAAHLMKQVQSAIASEKIKITEADLVGNKHLAKQLRQQRADMELQLRQYRDLLTIHNDTYSAKTGLITKLGVKHTKGGSGGSSGGSSTGLTSGDIVWFQQALNQIIRLMGGNPMSVGSSGRSSGSSFGGGSSSSGVPNYGPGSIKFIPEPKQKRQHHITIHHHYNIQTMARSQSEVKNLMDLIEQEQAKRFRMQTAGYSSGGIF